MRVYGDHARWVAGDEALARVIADAASLSGEPKGLIWHDRCATLLIGLGSLLQGVADRDLEARGFDDRSPEQDSLTAALLRVAAAVRESWRSCFASQQAPGLDGLGGLALSGPLLLKRPEGYAYYALYPEAYIAAAAAVPPGAVVIGLRSIGTGLAAAVAEACAASAVLTLRPQGHPFSRTVSASTALERFVRASANRPFAIVDEGPGLSGSSFGGTADWLEALGVQRQRIMFLAGHPGPLGPQANEKHRRRWSAAARPCVSFDELFLSDDSSSPLATWFEDLTGPATAPLRDLSGGAWTEVQPLPSDPAREARKFLAETERGRFRLKFVGLGEAAAGKLARAEALHQAGFGLRPIGLRHGFMIEEEVAGTRPACVPVERLADYLAFRDASFPAEVAGASLAELVAMAENNLAEAGVAGELGRLHDWAARAASDLQPLCRPVHVDARLHRWEWLEVGGKLVKTDALDHAEAHDLVGCQDIAWDVAGAIVEHELVPADAELLWQRVLGGRSRAAELTRLMLYGYLGFQVGWWAMSSSALGRERSGWYARQALRLLAGSGPNEAAWPWSGPSL